MQGEVISTKRRRCLGDGYQRTYVKIGKQSDEVTAEKTPTRTLRRRKSHPDYRKKSDEGTTYYVKGKGKLLCTRTEEVTPGRGSGSSEKRRRKFSKVAASPPGRGAGTSPAAAESLEEASETPAGNILGEDDASEDDPFAS